MKVGILTSVNTRHRFFARTLAQHVDVVAVGYEETGYTPAAVDPVDLTAAEKQIVANHFAERDRQERIYFGPQSDFLSDGDRCRVQRLSPGTLNTTATLDLLGDVDAVVVYGTNLIKPPLLDRWPGRMLNMHLGLSPYYRGTATNFYPLVNEEPEYVGATIHLIDAGIDSGAICRHARPNIVADDQPHTIGCKAILAGIDAMIAVLQQLPSETIHPVRQWTVPNPHLYLRKDYHPRQVVELYQKLDDGLIARYALRAAEVADRVRLVGEQGGHCQPIAKGFQYTR